MNLPELFKKQGYVVIENAFRSDTLDQILNSLERIKLSKNPPFYFSQATHRYLPIELDKNGYLKESILGFTRNWGLKQLSKLGEDLLLGQIMIKNLEMVFPQYSGFLQQNNMLFDASIGTVDHIDSWYLDTYPKGSLIGAWIALEDINPDSGPFRVYPGSHLKVLPYELQKLEHKDFLGEIEKIKKQFKCKELILKKGDLVFWHPFTIHGASPVQNNKYSRKSITSHYLPLNATIQSRSLNSDQNTIKIILRKILQYPNKKSKHYIYQLNTIVFRLLENITLKLMKIRYKLFRSKNELIHNDMRSASYEFNRNEKS
tara:strand:- start:356 stop:1303 length:948 start_codon:yes stop_codon:yes gene_type:complete